MYKKGVFMKKIIIGILGLCLLVGIPFMIMDLLAEDNGAFNIPSGYKKIEVNLNEKARKHELVYTKELKNAAEISFMIQCDTDIQSIISIESDKKLIGSSTDKEVFDIRKITGSSYLSPKMLLQPGKYSIRITNVQTDGEIVIGYKEKELKEAEYKRLLKIDNGELNNPPKGYELVYSSDLSDLDYDNKEVYTLTLERARKTGISVYTNASTGIVSVDFMGENSNFTGLVTPKLHYICDQMENIFQKGTYKIHLTSENAKGQIYIFIKK